LGYDRHRLLVIPNGFDLAQFHPSPTARPALRAELGLQGHTPLVGLIGRYHPVKDHATFFAATAQIGRRVPTAHFLLCGANTTWQNGPLVDLVQQAQLASRCHLLDPRDDMPAVQASLDVAVLSSRSEGLPNSVGEAMACGVPCVVTDVGDAAARVAETGRLVPAGDANALAESCVDLLKLSARERRRLGIQARTRIEQHYHLPQITRRYAALWQDLAAAADATAPAATGWAVRDHAA
jgi:glycosyltransferase involved in cell wall biosynthesis